MKKVTITILLFLFYSFTFSQNYITVDTNKIAVSITSTGKIGYLLNNYQQGDGFSYDTSGTLMMCGGFLIGNSTSQVDDNIYSEVAGILSNDWKSFQLVHQISSSISADEKVEGLFNDSLAGIYTLGLSVRQRAYSWHSAPYDKFVVLEYTIMNESAQALTALYAGLFMDWDISSDSGQSDRTNYDSINNMGYCYSSFGGTYTAIKLLDCNGESVHHYAFDNDGSSNGTSFSINISDGFTNYEKYSALKINQFRNLAGVNGNGNDVSDMISTGPFVLYSGDSIKVTFALIAGDSLPDIQTSAIAAYNAYCQASSLTEYQQLENITISEIYPNPSNDFIEFSINNPSNNFVKIEIINSIGQLTHEIWNDEMTSGINKFASDISNLSTGIYQVVINTKTQCLTKKFVKE